MSEKEITELLYEITGDSDVLDPECELIESGILDSLAIIDLFTLLEDRGIEIYPTQIDRKMLSTPTLIVQLVNNISK